MSVENLLCTGLLLLARLSHSLVEFHGPLFIQRFLVDLCLLLERVFRVQFVRQQVVVLLVMLLDVRGQLLCMRFLQSFDSFVVRLEFSYLLFELLHSAVEATFDLLKLALEVDDSGLVIFI